MATYAEAIRALKDALATDWTTTPVVEENEDPPGLIDAAGVPSPFVFVEIQSDSAEQRSIGSPGSDWFESKGAMIATVFVPSGIGADLATQHAAAIGDLFRNRQITLDGSSCVQTWAPHVGRGTPATSEAPEGRWWSVAVSIPYEFLHSA